MQPDWDELAKKEVKAERERLASDEKSNRVFATILGVLIFVIYLVVDAVQWFLGNPASLRDIGWALGSGLVMWVLWTESMNFGSRREARQLRQIRIEKKLDEILSAQNRIR